MSFCFNKNILQARTIGVASASAGTIRRCATPSARSSADSAFTVTSSSARATRRSPASRANRNSLHGLVFDATKRKDLKVEDLHATWSCGARSAMAESTPRRFYFFRVENNL